jgi:hypothetical protein
MKSRRWGKSAVILATVFGMILTAFAPVFMSQSAYAALADVSGNEIVKKDAAYNTLDCLRAISEPGQVNTVDGINDIRNFNWQGYDHHSQPSDREFMLMLDKGGNVDYDGFSCYWEAIPYAFTALGKSVSASSSDTDKIQVLCDLGYVQTRLSANTPSVCPESAGMTRGSTDQLTHVAGKTWARPSGFLSAKGSDYAGAYMNYLPDKNMPLASGDGCYTDVPTDGTWPEGFDHTTVYVADYSGGNMVVRPKLLRTSGGGAGSEFCGEKHKYFSATVSGTTITLGTYAQAFANDVGAKAVLAGSADDTSDDTTNDDSTTVGTDQDPCYAAQTHGFGWIVCPGMTWMTAAIDGLVGWITGGLQWTMLTDTAGDSGATIRDVWASMLTLANIAFAIAFMIIIYSTATSSGISNYGIKKILPRLVVAAVGVNLSFYLCAALADLSNIAGVGLNDLIMARMSGGNNGATMFGTLWDGLLKAGVTLLIVIFTWATVFIGMLTIFIAIALRTVALTMLVIVSPLAIVASLLPNTEKWFKKWRDTYIQLLVVYPAFMAVWAGCRLVANVATNIGADWSWMISSLATLAPLAVIIPLFKSTSGLMGKMTSLTEKGIGAAGGNALKGLNKKSNAYLRDRGARVAKNAVAGRISEAGQEAGERGKEVAALEKKKAESWTQADDARLKSLNDRVIAGETLVGDELKEHNDLAQKQVAHASGAIQDWGASDEAELGKARTAKAEADRRYSRRANGLLRKGVFMASDMRFNKANREAETKRTEQSELARRLSQDDAYRARYAGVTAGMSAAEADARMNRALNQASAIGNKASEEERSNFGSLLSDASTISDSEKGQFGTAENFSNAMAANLVKDPDYEVTISNNGVERKLSWKTMTDNERLVVFQQAASMGSSPEVATTSNALDTGKLFDDPALQNAAASMVVKSGNKGFWAQGANVANSAAGKVTTAAQKTINVTKAPIAAGVMSSFDKGAHWGDVVASMPDVAALAAKPGPEGDDARASLTNLRNAIRANLSQPGGSRYVAAVGSEYREILRAAGVDDADIEALFNSTGADADMVSDAMTRKETKANGISPKLMT